MLKVLSYLICGLFLISCSNISFLCQKNSSENSSKNNYRPAMGVDFTPPELTVQDEAPRIRTEETVDILDGKVFVEDREERNHNANKINPRKIKLGLILGPGLSRSVGHISVLRSIERSGTRIDFVSGTEMGAIIGAMYASGMTPEMIEWNFYKYFREKSNAKVFSPKWIEEIDEHFLKKFQNVRVEKLKKYFYVPLYSKKLKKVVFFNKGNLRNLLILNLKTRTQSPGLEYTNASEFEVFNSGFMRSAGAEVVVGIDALGDKVSLKDSNEFLYGVYQRFIGNIKKDKKSVDLYFPLPLENSHLDSDEDAGANLQNASDYAQKIILEIDKKRELKAKAQENVSQNCENGCV
ncbi:MAG: patatin-like phospholipase family protein [Bacteriovoracaceae bacterium]|nr:patatin-like phospholipase family protein [Bacteriovoracaceae bacterium]